MRFSNLLIAALFTMAGASAVPAQDAKSASLAKELAAVLDAGKLDSIAAKHPANPDVFCAALYVPGVQLLVVWARYTAPQLLTDRLAKKEYRDVYLDLNGASVRETKVFIEDMGTDGLKLKRDGNQLPDTYEEAGKRTVF